MAHTHTQDTSGTQATSYETVPFTTGDGRTLSLKHLISDTSITKGPVLLVHGAGVRADIFLAPVQKNIAEYLSENGYDVWLENWRASIDFEPNQWTLDQAAVFDHPYAVKKVVEISGAKSIKAIIHCQGSTSFMMSLVAGLVPQVETVISNAVSLHPIVPTLSKVKIMLATWPIRLLTPYLNPQWGKKPVNWVSRMIKWIVDHTHSTCESTVCQHASFTYGASDPTLWRHENLNKETHDVWLDDEFGFLPTRFYSQIGRSIRKGSLLAIEKFAELPRDFTKVTPKTDARIAFFSGNDNVCFLPESQVKTFNYFNNIKPGFHSLHIVDNYGHLCMFMGKNAAEDVFPLILAELDKNDAFTPTQSERKAPKLKAEEESEADVIF